MTFDKFVNDTENARRIFLAELESYQGNHYGTYNRELLRQAWLALPHKDKTGLKPTKANLRRAYRGDDGHNGGAAISFTTHEDEDAAKSNASFYGSSVFSISQFEIEGAADMAKLVRVFGVKRLDQFYIGDGENEIIAFGANPKTIG